MNLLEVMVITDCEITLSRTDYHGGPEQPSEERDQFCASLGACEIKDGIIAVSACGFGVTPMAAMRSLAERISRMTLIKDCLDKERRREWRLPHVTAD